MNTEALSLQTPSPQAAANSKLDFINRVLVIVLVVGMLIHLLTLTTHPLVFIDEGWLSNASWTWLKTGVNFDSIHAGTLDQFGYKWLSRFFVGEAPYVLSFGIFGLGLFQARLVAWFFGGILLLATVLAGRRLYNLTVGLLASVFLMIGLQFLQASRWRQDIMLTAFVMLAFWLALVALQENKLWAHVVAGFLLGVGLDVHQSSVLFIPALAGLYLSYYGIRILFKRGTWAVAIGGALGLAIYAGIHILPSPETYSKLMSFNFVDGAQAALPITHPATMLASLIGEIGRYGFRRNPVDLALIIVGGLWLLKRRSKSDIWLLVFTGIAFVDFVLFSGDKTNLYAIHLYPFFMLIVANIFMSVIFQKGLSKLLQQGTVVLLVLYMGFGVYRTADAIRSTLGYDYYAVTDKIKTVIPPEARVMGMPLWWFGFADYDYRSSLSLTYYKFYNGLNVAEALEQIHPDYIIFDGIQGFVLQTDDDEVTPALAVFGVSETEFLDFLADRGQQVLTFDDPYHGRFEIWQVNWDDGG